MQPTAEQREAAASEIAGQLVCECFTSTFCCTNMFKAEFIADPKNVLDGVADEAIELLEELSLHDYSSAYGYVPNHEVDELMARGKWMGQEKFYIIGLIRQYVERAKEVPPLDLLEACRGDKAEFYDIIKS